MARESEPQRPSDEVQNGTVFRIKGEVYKGITMTCTAIQPQYSYAFTCEGSDGRTWNFSASQLDYYGVRIISQPVEPTPEVISEQQAWRYLNQVM